jgi:hypothetical protein
MIPTRAAFLFVLALGIWSATPTSREDAEMLFRVLEAGSPAEALAADESLSTAYDDAHLVRLEKALDAAPARTLQLVGELSTQGSARMLLNRLPYLLESKDPEVARMAAVAAGLRRLKEATTPLLQHLEEPHALRALGRIWTQAPDAQPLPRSEEIHRLTVLAVAHRQTMGASPTLAACETMLLVMTEAELSDFLSKHAAEKFSARHLCDEAVRRTGFDADKGLLIHEALLSSPDAGLVAAILETSPFPLREGLIRRFLSDERLVSPGVRVGDFAARRLRR